jgi:hypothetical protein
MLWSNMLGIEGMDSHSGSRALHGALLNVSWCIWGGMRGYVRFWLC